MSGVLRTLAVALLLVAAGCGGEAPGPGTPPAAPGSPQAGARAAAPTTTPAPASASAPVPGPRPADGTQLGAYPRAQFFIQRDLFLPADDPRTVPAQDARFLRDDDEVLGLVVGGQARAYPVTMLAYHHVVNDVIEGIPVAVTY